MKVLLLVNLNSRNLGDDFISNELDKSFKKLCANGDEVITRSFVFFRSDNIRIVGLFSGFFKLIYNIVKVNKVVIAGGNLLMPRSDAFLLSFFISILVSKFFRKKIIICCVGASGFDNSIRSKFFKYLLSDIEIMVRDKNSQNLLIDKLGVKSKCIADAAFLKSNKPFKSINMKKIIFIPISYESFYFEKNNVLKKEYFYQIYYNFIDSIIEKYDIEILTTDLTDHEIAIALSKKFNLEYRKMNNVDQLYNYFSNANGFVVSTRMHGGIISLLNGLPTIFLNWHQKVLAISEEFDFKVPVLEMEELDIKNILKLVELTDWDIVENKINEKNKILSSEIIKIFA